VKSGVRLVGPADLCGIHEDTNPQGCRSLLSGRVAGDWSLPLHNHVVVCPAFSNTKFPSFDAGDRPLRPAVEPLGACTGPSGQPHARTASGVEDLNGSLEKSLPVARIGGGKGDYLGILNPNKKARIFDIPANVFDRDAVGVTQPALCGLAAIQSKLNRSFLHHPTGCSGVPGPPYR